MSHHHYFELIFCAEIVEKLKTNTKCEKVYWGMDLALRVSEVKFLISIMHFCCFIAGDFMLFPLMTT